MKKHILVVLLSLSASAAQSISQVKGEIKVDSVRDLSNLMVQVQSDSHTDMPEVTHVGFNGDFEFRNLNVGNYTLRVIDSFGNEYASQPLTVSIANSEIAVRLPERTAAERPTGQRVSVTQLRRKPDKRAFQACVKAQRFAEAGNRQRAAAELEKAIAIDPEFAEAHGNLGAQYAALGRMVEAEAQFRKSVELDPNLATFQSNLAVTLSQLGKLQEAEVWARRAVKLDGTNPLGHYVLGCILAARAEARPEAIQHLQIAGRQFPKAHFTLATLYRSMGNADLAKAELNEFQQASVPAGQPAPSAAFMAPQE